MSFAKVRRARTGGQDPILHQLACRHDELTMLTSSVTLVSVVRAEEAANSRLEHEQLHCARSTESLQRRVDGLQGR
jgi:CHASE1-domain containing sensor protein